MLKKIEWSWPVVGRLVLGLIRSEMLLLVAGYFLNQIIGSPLPVVTALAIGFWVPIAVFFVYNCISEEKRFSPLNECRFLGTGALLAKSFMGVVASMEMFNFQAGPDWYWCAALILFGIFRGLELMIGEIAKRLEKENSEHLV